MRSKREGRQIWLAALLACSLSGEAGAQFSSTVFFGDSLTDAGTIPATFPGVLPPGTGKFTTNPGPVWAELLAQDFGKTANPAAAGGTNYAWGGARVSALPGYPDTSPLTAAAMPIATQIATYLAARGGRADSNALYTVWGGANDVFVIASGDPASAQAGLAATTSSLTNQVAMLKAAGARYVIVPNLPDIGITPFGLSLGASGSAALTQLSAGYNQLLSVGLASAGVSVIPVDTFALLREIASRPAAYGFTNVTGTACNVGALPGNSSLFCTSAALVAPDAQNTYLFADGVHPSSATHRVIAQYVEGLLVAPGQISLLLESSVKTRRSLLGTMHDQINASSWSRPATNNVWVSSGGGRLKFDQNTDFQGTSGTPYNVTVGADAKVSPELILGGAFTSSRYHPDFSGNRGGYEQDESVLSLYSGYGAGPMRLNLIGSIGTADFTTRRRVPLGSGELTVPGSTSGYNLSLSALGSYEFEAGPIRHGPTVGLDVQSVRIKAFAEGNRLSAGLSYAEQRRNSVIGSVGYRVSYDAGQVLPFARLSIDHDFARRDRDIDVSYMAQPGPKISFAAATPERTFASVAAGALIKLAQNITGTVAVSALAAQKDVHDYGVQVGLSVGF